MIADSAVVAVLQIRFSLCCFFVKHIKSVHLSVILLDLIAWEAIPTHLYDPFSPLDLLRKKKSVPMSELPEEAQRLKRAAWRAASRRYYARKVARQQANPSRPPVPFPRITDSRYSQPHNSLVDKRRRTLISELPDDCQTLQREAWRAASRRYYARKTARHQTEATQYVHLLQNIEPSEETLGPNTGESHTNSGGIMCS